MASIIRFVRGYYCHKCKIDFAEEIDFNMHICRQ